MDVFQDLGSFLDRETVVGECPFLLISEVDLADGCFLVSHLVARHLACGHGVCLVTTTRSFHHYQQLGSKLGSQFEALRQKGQLIVIEGLKVQLELSKETRGLGAGAHLIGPLFQRVKEAILKLKANDQPYFLIVDDLSVWIHVGFALREVLSFVQGCRSLTSGQNGSLGAVLCEETAVEDGSNQRLLCRLLAHWCDMKMRVANLPTGLSKDVHGQLMITWRNRTLKWNAKVETIHLHFKVEEKRVLMFAPGTSPAVL